MNFSSSTCWNIEESSGVKVQVVILLTYVCILEEIKLMNVRT